MKKGLFKVFILSIIALFGFTTVVKAANFESGIFSEASGTTKGTKYGTYGVYEGEYKGYGTVLLSVEAMPQSTATTSLINGSTSATASNNGKKSVIITNFFLGRTYRYAGGLSS